MNRDVPEFWQETDWHTQGRAEWNLMRKLYGGWTGIREPIRGGEVAGD